MKRYASHFLFLPRYGFLERRVVELQEGRVSRVFPLTEEVENTEWMPGVIALLPPDADAMPDFSRSPRKLPAMPSAIGAAQLRACVPVLFFPFDFTAMQPVAGTRRRPLL